MTDLHGRSGGITRLLIIGYLAVGFVTAMAAWISVSRIESEIAGHSRLHEIAYNSLLRIDSLAGDGAQELFAYLLSGSETELADSRAAAAEITAEFARYASVAEISETAAQAQFRAFTGMQNAWAEYSTHSALMVAKFQQSGAAKPQSFNVVEKDLDAFFGHLDFLLKAEAGNVAAARQQQDKLLQESERLIVAVAAAGLIALVVVGGIVTRQIARYIAQLKERDLAVEIQRTALDATRVGICYTDPLDDNKVVFVNEAITALTGYSADELLGKNCRMLQGVDTDTATVADIREAVANGQPIQTTILNYRKNGDSFWNNLHISPVRDASGVITRFVGAMTDITEKLDLERQLSAAQRMEVVGKLAGGVAHDFNNYLMVIRGNAELLNGNETSEEDREKIEQILDASDRSAALTRHLLAFSRRQVMVPQVLDLNRVIVDLGSLLSRTVGEQIDVEIVTAAGLGLVSADRSQIEQVLMNLVVNAQAAISGAGHITIETGNVYLDREYVARSHSAKEGRYVMIAVSDTGRGIPKDVRERIFEPFYSAGESGGSGLGLSTVAGIVDQSGGSIQVYSEEGSGTTFKVYLPRIGGKATMAPKIEAEPIGELRGTVLVVEDDEMVRDITCKMLRGLDLSVLEAADGVDGLECIRERGDEIDLLLTDVVLPRLGGRALAEEVSKLRPSIRILFMSGYTENGILHHGRLDEGIQLIQKPFTQRELKHMLGIAMGKSKAG